MELRDFFISYTNSDEAWARWIADVLKSNGYTVYVQALDIKPGDSFLEKMEEFVENSANFIAVWSEAYSKSVYCMTEFRAAFHEWKEGRMECVLPVRVDGHPMKRLYSPLVRVDLSDMGATSEMKLVDAVHYAVPRLVVPQAIQMQEDAEILYQRGAECQFNKNGVVPDYTKAREYYERAAAKGHAKALNALGILYQYGRGVEPDYSKAREYYVKAAAKGNKYALYNLGWLYEYGEGVNVDYNQALEYYQKSIDAGMEVASANVEGLRAKMRRKRK